MRRFRVDELRKLNEAKERARAEYEAYLSKHAELKRILGDFTDAIVREKPEDVYRFAFEHFRHFAKGELAEMIRPKLKLETRIRANGTDLRLQIHECFDKKRWMTVSTWVLTKLDGRKYVSEFSDSFVRRILRRCDESTSALDAARLLSRRLVRDAEGTIGVAEYDEDDERPFGMWHVTSPTLKECDAALTLECAWRSYLARGIVAEARKRYWAAVSIQNCYRVHESVRITTEKRRRRDAATLLQSRFRGGRARVRVLELLEGDTRYTYL
eukprot:g2491.t1